VGSGGTILRTTDGGTTWEQQSSGTTALLNGVFFTDANTGTAVGSGGTILRTTDGGATWEQQSSGTTAYLAGVFFTDANTGTAVGGEEDYLLYDISLGIILRTTDGGATWKQQSGGTSRTTTPLYGVFFTDANAGTAVGYNGTILRTTTGGEPVASQTTPGTKPRF
jgi:photosystem II stability/assembly factor-like uncharacterized protein